MAKKEAKLIIISKLMSMILIPKGDQRLEHDH